MTLPVPEPLRRLEGLAQRHLVPGDGCLVCWRGFGAGPPLVLLHGGHGSWLHWVRNIEALSQRFTLWLPDMPGYGDSGDIPAGRLAPLVSALRASLDALLGSGTPIRLGGFSFGGLVATHLAAQREGVTRLVLLGSAGHGSQRRPRGKLRNWQAESASGDSAALAAVMRHNLAVHMLNTEADDIDELALHAHTWSAQHTRFRSKEIARAGGIGALLETLPGRLRLAWGEHDVTAEPAVLVRELAAAHPDREACVIEGAGHWAQYERPEAVNTLLLRWLA